MNRLDTGLLALGVVGIIFLLTAPPDPQFSVSVSDVDDVPEEATVTAFEALSADGQQIFQNELDDNSQFFAQSPDIPGYVSYEGTTYRVYVSVHEGPVLSIIQPRAGGLCLLVSGVGLVGSRLYRWRSNEE